MSEESVLRIARAPTNSADLLGALANIESSVLEFEEISVASLEDGFKMLDDGDTDLLLGAAIDISNSNLLNEGFQVIGALPLRDWNSVLVSEDRPRHLPKNAIVLSENQLVRRQLRRLRSDLRVRSASAHIGIEESVHPEELIEGDLFSFSRWAEELRQTEEIDGYVIPRHIHRLAGMKTRRHALSQEPAEDELIRFLPSPHAGTILVVGRIGFPRQKFSQLLDDEAETSWRIGEIILTEMDEDLKSKVGILVRHRQPATLLREAERKKDLLTHNVLIDPEGELTTSETKVDIQIELIGHRGNSTISIQRIADLEDAIVATRFMVQDWKKLVKLGEQRSDFLDL
jgi:hypothetical protein